MLNPFDFKSLPPVPAKICRLLRPPPPSNCGLCATLVISPIAWGGGGGCIGFMKSSIQGHMLK